MSLEDDRDLDLEAARAYEARAHAASIRAIPPDQLLDDAARAELVRRALRGEEVYAYRPAHQPEWVVWVYRGNPAEDCRHAPAEWAQTWHAEAAQEGEAHP